jgi:phosphoenolpyruvate-protein phosphotransferase/dihydroxyacetone kinase phosphotransfer subunit
MVGIVLVSHSHEVAAGAAELARQMGGQDVRIEAAGGLDEPGHPIGTDAMRVVAAIDAAWSDDGVLVLMDLGSAVLSTELALDFLDEERRPKVLLTDAPFVEGAVAAAVAAKLGRPLAEVAEEARGGLAGKHAHLGEPEASAPDTEQEAPAAGPEVRLTLTVDLPHGLHARPAARFVQTASGFDADVRVSNATTGRGPVSARSLNAVATLGVVEGQTIEVVARGSDAPAVAEALRSLATRRFDEAQEDLVPRSAAPLVSAPAAPPGALHGFPASPGIAIGPARRFHVPDLPDVRRAVGTVEEERAALEAALADTRTDVERQREDASARVGAGRAAIFEAHLLFLQDDALLRPALDAVAAGVGAAAAWSESVRRMAAAWEGLEDPYLRARAADLRSVGRQVLARLLGVAVPRPQLSSAGILVANDLEPADTAGLDPGICLGIATGRGGPTSHAAVLARALGIPAAVGLGDGLDAVEEGATVGLDGNAGALYVDPDPVVVDRLERTRAEETTRATTARSRAAEPATTLDGITVEVAANIGTPADVEPAVAAGCDGVGLFRTEFLFMGRDAMPDADEQEAAYRSAAEALAGRPMVVRTLDAGADKPLPYLDQAPEANPFLGVRGIRLGLARPDVLDPQLRALVLVAADHPVRIMFPMVATLDELRAARAAVERAMSSTGVDTRPAIGIMVEVPAAALAATHLAPEVDFFSVGTNDLTQYTLAADRGNALVAPLADALHPAVLRLIAMAADAAAANGAWTGVCGELAGDPIATPILLGLGVRELSMAPPAIPLVKEAVRDVDLHDARARAVAAMAASSAGEVRALAAG